MLPIEYADYLYVFGVKTGQEEKAVDEIKAAFNDEVTPLQLLVATFLENKERSQKKLVWRFRVMCSLLLR